MTVSPIDDTVPLLEVKEEVERRSTQQHDNHIYILLERDNPEVAEDEARRFFESLRRLFRTKQGCIVIIWPITDGAIAASLARAAWNIGADSVVDQITKPGQRH